MREYAKLGPTFWTGETGKAIRRRGSEAVIVSLYLISSPHSNMLGLYYQPILYMAHETGLGIEGATKGLRDCVEEGFCSYDEDTEMVFVHEMALWQIADVLSSTDKRCKGIQKDYEALPACPFLEAWFDRYVEAFKLTKKRSNPGEKPEVRKAPSKSHRSQEQEQEQEPPSGVAPEGPSSPKPPKPHQQPPQGIAPQVWSDWLQVRKGKRAGPVTETAWSGLVREAAKAGITAEAAVRACCEFGWQGFNAGWYAQRKPLTAGRAPAALSFAERETARKAARYAEMTGGLIGQAATPPAPGEFIDMEPTDGAARLLG